MRVAVLSDIHSNIVALDAVLAHAGDVDALAAGPERFAWRAIARTLETAVDRADTGKSVAWFPLVADRVATHPAGRIWACVRGNRLTLFTLEGAGANR